MAVGSNPFSTHQLMPTSRGFVSSANGNGNGNGFGLAHNAQIGSAAPITSAAMPENSVPMNGSVAVGSVPTKAAMNTDCSGLSYNLRQPGVPTKRNREGGFISSGEDMLPLLQQHQSVIHSEPYQIVANHTKKFRMELEESKKQELRILLAARDENWIKKIREKVELIQTMRKLNSVQEEKLNNLFQDYQQWRNLAQDNEAAANFYRTHLYRVLAAFDGIVADAAAAPAEENGSESCVESPDPPENNGCGGRKCRGCGEKDSTVLLLPCRHLCLCTVCGSTLLSNCPVCNSAMNATVHVNMDP